MLPREQLYNICRDVLSPDAACRLPLRRQGVLKVNLGRPPRDIEWVSEARELLQDCARSKHGSPVGLGATASGRHLSCCGTTGGGAASEVMLAAGGLLSDIAARAEAELYYENALMPSPLVRGLRCVLETDFVGEANRLSYLPSRSYPVGSGTPYFADRLLRLSLWRRRREGKQQ